MKFPSISAVLALAVVAQAHMEMTWPYPFRSKYNPNTPQGQIDYSMTSPLDASGSNYPCKGYHSDFDTPAGKSVVTWQAGQTYNWTVAGSATHNGGSCQVMLSYDKGSSWKLLHSYVGNCPLQPTWSFDLPADTPAGDALFAWSWWNKTGNREMYQNCAHVTIAGAPKQKRKRSVCKPDSAAPASPSPSPSPSNAQTSAPAPAPAAPAASPASSQAFAAPGSSKPASSSSANSFQSRPAPFVANVGNGCGTLEGKDVLFPQPGPEVEMNSQGTAPPTGSCAGGKRRAMPLKA